MRCLGYVVVCGVLVGCGATVPVSESRGSTGGTATGPDTCNAAAYASLIGQDAVQALILPEPKRSYRPDEVVTTDFIPSRLNVELDETDTIVAIACG